MLKEKNLSVIVAGGTGVRLESKIPKQFIKLGEKTIIEHTIEKFDNHERIDSIYIITNEKYYGEMCEILAKNEYLKVDRILKGGKTRQESSAVGVKAAGNDFENILIHDAARPLVTAKIITDVVNKLKFYSAVNVGILIKDSVAKITPNNMFEKVLDREYLRAVQTPQGFKREIIQKAHFLAEQGAKFDFTDDCSLIYEYKLSEIGFIMGDERNLKITTLFDLMYARELMKRLKQKSE